MTSSAKTPTGKTSKGKVAIYIEKGRIKARLPRQYFGGKQPRPALGMEANEANMAKAQRIAERMTMDLEDGCFDETLVKYGIVSELEIKKGATTANDQLPPKPELSLLEVWDMFCEYKKKKLRESVYNNFFQGQYKSFLKSAIEATKSEDALKIRNWLVENRNQKTVKDLLSNLSKAYQLGMKSKLLSHNPYDGMAEEIGRVGARGKAQNEIETDNDTTDKSKAYTWDEVQIIFEYIQSTQNIAHWYNFIKFKFLTGCRTGEVVGLRWNDVKWDEEKVYIRFTYDRRTKKFYPLKNDRTYKGDEVRKFPMPKDGELWNLLKSIPQGEPSDVVFKSKRGTIIDDTAFRRAWMGNKKQKYKGIIPELISQGKLTKYLSPYNTRHTFINHAIHDLGIPEKIVCYMCGHKPDVSNKHYQDEAIFMKGINPEIPFSQQQFSEVQIDNQQSRIEALEAQNRELMEMVRKLQEQLEQMKYCLQCV
ncbi:phage integrase [Calothrix sp. NIES-2100]|uniref:tyrosine-type recombinase/integrase n=1 Tax=Calothrix sp. NIES-2100 TaxID=1954172 RepID=UPI000B61FA1E|nr:phage integrase [Calothrix sp. NIES-2100]